MSDADGVRELVVLDEIVPAGKLWGHAVRQGEILRLVDLEGQQTVDFLCFDAADQTDRYSATNTIKGLQQILALAGPFRGQERVLADHEPLAGKLRGGELSQIALVEQ